MLLFVADTLQRELKQNRPFRSPAQEGLIAIVRTSDQLRRVLGRVIEAQGVTGQQFNVLRILRGAAPDPLPVLEIGERMIEETPGITRLLDRLEAKGLVTRARCLKDRRQVHCRITAEGLGLLKKLDGPVSAAEEAVMKPIGRAGQQQLIDLLDQLRAAVGHK
jgi:DNA-binding MarR family transcriptional regulator